MAMVVPSEFSAYKLPTFLLQVFGMEGNNEGIPISQILKLSYTIYCPNPYFVYLLF